MAADTQIYTSKYTGKQIDNTLSTCYIKNLEVTDGVTGVELSSNVQNAVVVNDFIKEDNKYKIKAQRVISLDSRIPKIVTIYKDLENATSTWGTSIEGLDKNLGASYCDVGGIPTNASILGIRITSNNGVGSYLENITDRDTWPEIICDNRIIKENDEVKVRIYSNMMITGRVRVTYSIGGN